jgi:hypothetical protein
MIVIFSVCEIVDLGIVQLRHQADEQLLVGLVGLVGWLVCIACLCLLPVLVRGIGKFKIIQWLTCKSLPEQHGIDNECMC